MHIKQLSIIRFYKSKILLIKIVLDKILLNLKIHNFIIKSIQIYII